MLSTVFGGRAREHSHGEQDSQRPLLESREPSAAREYLTMVASRERLTGDEDLSQLDADSEDEHESDEDGDDPADEPLLPMFSASHLDALPTYNITHSIRELICQRCETTLTWEQLRSPQVSQFLVKPMQLSIRSSHLSRATLYALVSNCLQFSKEAQVSPGNVGVLRTRAAVAELLAMRLLKEFSTSELIDALSYDFDPLVGMTPPAHGPALNRFIKIQDKDVYSSNTARTSTLEVAIRAQAKNFLSHPLVVRHLEAIWAGSIVFHSAADSLHRMPSKPPLNPARHLGGTHDPSTASLTQQHHHHRKDSLQLGSAETVRRAVTLYDPANASMFKLSRLRVPRYRQAFTTISYIIMVGLYVAVLRQKKVSITPLEVVFWLWSAGFLLDEVVEVTENGFGLYMLSFWNLLDIGVLLLFISYYILRIYSIALYGKEEEQMAAVAYDLLGSSAILLFPRMFSFLDHYRYFSQLLIAFRMMVQELMAVLILIAISCSGFFVAFTLSFGTVEWSGGSVAYGLFQLLMGFTPAAWTVWKDYNVLGKILLTVFLFLTHFLVVTILISVLTNSFTSVVKNANEEHQYLYAVNVLSMVKSDALFSYVTPTNLLGLAFSPLRFIVPFRQYVRINRTVIKVTHFPVLFLIFVYERTRLARFGHTPTEIIEQRGRSRRLALPFGMSTEGLFAPGARVREPSVATFKKDRALDEVFRKPYPGNTLFRKESRLGDGESNVVKRWMTGIQEGDEDEDEVQSEGARSLLEDLDVRRPGLAHGRFASRQTLRKRDASPMAMSMASDPDFMWKTTRRRPRPWKGISDESATRAGASRNLTAFDERNETSPDRGDEPSEARDFAQEQYEAEDTPERADFQPTENQRNPISPGISTRSERPSKISRRHNRQASTNTMIYSPLDEKFKRSEPSKKSTSPQKPSPRRKSPQRTTKTAARPFMPPRDAYLSAPNIAAFLGPGPRQPSASVRALDLGSDLDGNRDFVPDANLLSGSFETQMEWANRNRMQQTQEDAKMMSRMVLARMGALEESFKDILQEVKGWKNPSSASSSSFGGARHHRAHPASNYAKDAQPSKDGDTEMVSSQRPHSLDGETVYPQTSGTGHIHSSI